MNVELFRAHFNQQARGLIAGLSHGVCCGMGHEANRFSEVINSLSLVEPQSDHGFSDQQLADAFIPHQMNAVKKGMIPAFLKIANRTAARFARYNVPVENLDI